MKREYKALVKLAGGARERAARKCPGGWGCRKDVGVDGLFGMGIDARTVGEGDGRQGGQSYEEADHGEPARDGVVRGGVKMQMPGKEVPRTIQPEASRAGGGVE
jgi:hypothetical protein